MKNKQNKNSIISAIIYMALYIFAGMIVYNIGITVYYSQSYSYDSLPYKFAQVASRLMPVIIIGYVCIGFIFIFKWILNKELKRRQEEDIKNIVKAMDEISKNDDEEISLDESLNEVEQKINQIKREVRTKERIAREAEQRKNDLVVYLAHDLKTPLTSVIGYLSLLRDEEEISHKLRQKYLGIAVDKSERLEELINEFFEITRFNLSKLTLETSRVDLKLLLEQLVFEFEPMFAEKHLECNLHMDEKLIVTWDIDKMQRVFDNLLKNAVSYSFENESIDIYVNKKDENVEIIFENKGNDIPKEKLARIFEQFYRLDSARSSGSGGAGLGLAISKEIVELHNGNITASSENNIITMKVVIPQMS